MNRPQTHPDTLLDDALAATRGQELSDAQVAAAADRVWARIETAAHEGTVPVTLAAAIPSGPITGCAGYQALIPAYLAGQLPAARAGLLEAHARECVPCRRALKLAREGAPAATAAPRSFTLGRQARMALAAGLTAVVGLGAWLAYDRLLPAGGEATVVAVDGNLWTLDAPQSRAKAAGIGTAVPHGTTLRTSGGSRAVVRLPDGTLVEMDERASLSVGARRRETVIDLDRGAIIVQAAKQLAGRQLHVATEDCQVAVVGTIFAVNHGTKGSRVSVLEGSVKVAHGRSQDMLRPGQQVTTSQRLGRVPVAQEIAWSRDRDSYLALLAELSDLEQEIREQVAGPGQRTDTTLLDAAPAATAVWVAVPNLAESLEQAYAVFNQRLAQSPVLAGYWQQAGGETIGPELEATLARLRDFGAFLGPEVAIAVLRSGEELVAPLAMATVTGNPQAFSTHLDAEIARINAEIAAEGGPTTGIQRIADPSTLPPADPQHESESLLVWVDGDRFVATPSPWALAQAAADAGGLAGSSFHQRLADAYREGVEWVVAADLATLVRPQATSDGGAVMAALGFDRAEHLVLESEEDGERTATQASFTFDGPRQGVPSWLAAPGPMGALDFVTPDATVAVGFLAKQPAAMLDDVLAGLGADAEALARFEQFEAEHGVSVRDDLAAPLGGELVFALDGPVLPVPAWKVVVEVNDGARFDQAVAWVVSELDTALRREGQGEAALTSETQDGLTVQVITVRRNDGTASEAFYTQLDGYAVIVPQRALIAQARDAQASGINLPASSRFRALLPSDTHPDLSGVVYAHLAPLMAPMGSLASGTGMLTPDQQALLGQLGEEPVLGWAYAEDDRITLAASTQGGLFGLDFGSLLGLGATLGMDAFRHHGGVDPGEAPAAIADEEAETATTTGPEPGRGETVTGART